MNRPALILSHVALAALGASLALHSQQAASPPWVAATVPVPTSHPQVAAAAGKTGMPPRVALASPAAWRAAWDQALLGPRAANGEPQIPNPIGFFVDWCEVDPDGAIRGLAKTYAPHFAFNFLGNAVQAHGAILAPALVKHYHEVKSMADYQLDGYVGMALNKLAKEDPSQPAGLLASLPPGVRGNIYRNVFDQQDRRSLDQLYTAMPASANPGEASRRGEAYAAAVDVADPERGVWNGIAETSDPTLRRAFALEGARKAQRGEDWSGFFDAVERLEPSARDEIRKTLQSHVFSEYQEKARAAIAEECRHRGLDDWTQRSP